MGVIPWSPLAGGWLSGRYTKGGESPGVEPPRADAARRATTCRSPATRPSSRPPRRSASVAEQAGHVADRDVAPLRHLPPRGHRRDHRPAHDGAAREPARRARAAGPARARCSTASTRSSRPGTNVNQADTGWDPPWLTDPSLRPPLDARVRIFSGIQPTGRKHLGNYIGAIAQYVSSQERGEGIFCIVDLHALTVAYDPGRAARAPLRHDRDPARRRARPGALHPVPPERRARAHRADLAAARASPNSAGCSACTSSATSPPRSASWSRPGCCSTRC